MESGRTVAPTVTVLWQGGPDQWGNFPLYSFLLDRKYLTLREGTLGRASHLMRKKVMSSMNQGWTLGKRIHSRASLTWGKRCESHEPRVLQMG